VYTLYGVYVQNFVNATVNLLYSMVHHPSMITEECTGSSVECLLALADLDNYCTDKPAYYFTSRYQDENIRHSQVAAIKRLAVHSLHIYIILKYVKLALSGI
jgi:hypothetical protein